MKYEDLPKRDGKRNKNGSITEQSQCPCGRWVNTIHEIDDETFVCGNCASRIINKQLEEKRRAREAKAQ